MTNVREKFDHPSWFTVGGAALGYGAILIVMFVLLFIVPFLLFSFL
ncbi:MAG: hypothetical protein ABEI77_00435 [Halorientalis sp.]